MSSRHKFTKFIMRCGKQIRTYSSRTIKSNLPRSITKFHVDIINSDIRMCFSVSVSSLLNKFIHERQEVQHVRAVHAFREGDRHVALRVENVRDAELFEDARVRRTRTLGDDMFYADVLEVQNSEKGRFEIFAYAADDAGRLDERKARYLRLAGAVRDDGLGDRRRNVLDFGRILVHGEDVVPEGREMFCKERPGVSETDDYKVFRCHGSNIENGKGQPTMMFSSAYQAPASCFLAMAEMRKSGPTRPTNIRMQRTSLPEELSSGVIPIESPQVA